MTMSLKILGMSVHVRGGTLSRTRGKTNVNQKPNTRHCRAKYTTKKSDQALVQEELRRITRMSRLASIERSDLVSCAWLGLYEARQRFDPKQGACFASYARLRIRGAILDGLAETTTLGRRGVRMVKRQLKLTHINQTVNSPPPLTPQTSSLHTDLNSGLRTEPKVHLGDQEEVNTQSFLERYRQLCVHMGNLWIDPLHERTRDPLITAQERERLQMMIDLISEAFLQLELREQELLIATFDFRGIGDNARAYAQRLGVHRSTIARRQSAILVKLKDWMIEHKKQHLNSMYAFAI